jgi:murein DD-endopeptidase MepM/ murein hydrolase activator NlpD
MRKYWENLADEISLWRHGWFIYLSRKLKKSGENFEVRKSFVVDILMARRGSYQRPFLHFSLMILFSAGIMSAPIIASAQPTNLDSFTPPSAVLTSLDVASSGIETQISEKPRDTVVNYTVQSGDTLSSVAVKFGISVDTIKWVNNIKDDDLGIGDVLKILPVTGVFHKVTDGETVYSIAKKYKTDAQKIVNFPFNDFADLDTFALNIGQTLVVPDGVIQQAPAIIYQAPVIIAGGSGQFMWPTNGMITQYPIWYHMAIDIANPSQPPVMAADGGTVILAKYLTYDYGHHVMIDHGNGFITLYGHMTDIYVKVGDYVKKGQVIGKMGSTGRSTGTHLHFEVRKNNLTQNPLSFLK